MCIQLQLQIEKILRMDTVNNDGTVNKDITETKTFSERYKHVNYELQRLELTPEDFQMRAINNGDLRWLNSPNLDVVNHFINDFQWCRYELSKAQQTCKFALKGLSIL